MFNQNQLLVLQVNKEAAKSGAVLGWSINMFWKWSADTQAAIWAGFDLALIFNNFKFRLRKFKDLTTNIA